MTGTSSGQLKQALGYKYNYIILLLLLLPLFPVFFSSFFCFFLITAELVLHGVIQIHLYVQYLYLYGQIHQHISTRIMKIFLRQTNQIRHSFIDGPPDDTFLAGFLHLL